MKRYTVILSPRALRDLEGIAQWIGREASAAVGRRYVKCIAAQCRKLARFPERGRPRDELRPGLRTIVFRASVTFGYIVRGDEVQVIGIVARGRDVEQVFGD